MADGGCRKPPFRSPLSLILGILPRTARRRQGRAAFARRSGPLTARTRDAGPETPQAPTVRVARKIALRKSKRADIWLNGLLTLAVVAALVIWAHTMLEMISEVVGLMPGLLLTAQVVSREL